MPTVEIESTLVLKFKAKRPSPRLIPFEFSHRLLSKPLGGFANSLNMDTNFWNVFNPVHTFRSGSV